MKLLTANEMQELDRQAIEEFGLPGIVLMENAGQATADQIEQHFSATWPGPVFVVAGKGNNGGDGYVIARHLMNRGWDVSVLVLSAHETIRGDARINLDVLTRSFAELYFAEDGDALFSVLDVVDAPALIVDALFGTGLSSEVKGVYADVINWINGTEVPVVSVDVPSGVDATSGKLYGPVVYADLTVTFAAAKVGHVVYPAAEAVGDLVVVDIGIPVQLCDQHPVRHFYVDAEMAGPLVPYRPDTGHKGTFGHLLSIGGSTGKTGAAALTAEAGLRAGAGLSTLACPASLNPIFEIKLTEVMTFLLSDKDGEVDTDSLSGALQVCQGKQAVVIGPGLGVGKGARALVARILSQVNQAVVVDADGLNVLSSCLESLSSRKEATILTPHPGELARLLGCTVAEVEADRLTVAANFASKYGVILILKGAPTVIATPDGKIFINGSGNSLLATGGTGDVLAGLIGGFLCQGCAPDVSAVLAVFLHGAAADRLADLKGDAGILASELLREIPMTRHLLANRSEELC
jgi:NAD(P)H-hydrate epimerase